MFKHNGFESEADRKAQKVIDDHPGSTLAAGYRAVAVELESENARLREEIRHMKSVCCDGQCENSER